MFTGRRRILTNKRAWFGLTAVVLLALLRIRDFRLLLSENRFIHNEEDITDWHWVQKRQTLLARDGPSKVLLFCYMRGGSTLAGSVYNADSSAVLWYEPLAAFYTAFHGLRYATKPHDLHYTVTKERSTLSTEEKTWMAQYLSDLFNCRHGRMPAESWLHPFAGHSDSMHIVKACIKKTTKRDAMRVTCPNSMDVCGETLEEARQKNCSRILLTAKDTLKQTPRLTSRALVGILETFAEETEIEMSRRDLRVLAERALCVRGLSEQNAACLKSSVSVCKARPIRVAEVVRFKMEDAQFLLAKDPDTHIVHYVRDPRGIALSRVSTAHLMVDEKNRNVWYEADCMCRQMRVDLQHRRLLERRYPGSVIQVKYEDLVTDPIEIVKRLYQTTGRRLSKTSNWAGLARQSFSHQDADHQFGFTRQNGTSTAYRWRDEISKHDLARITASCKDVLLELGYPLE